MAYRKKLVQRIALVKQRGLKEVDAFRESKVGKLLFLTYKTYAFIKFIPFLLGIAIWILELLLRVMPYLIMLLKCIKDSLALILSYKKGLRRIEFFNN